MKPFVHILATLSLCGVMTTVSAEVDYLEFIDGSCVWEQASSGRYDTTITVKYSYGKDQDPVSLVGRIAFHYGLSTINQNRTVEKVKRGRRTAENIEYKFYISYSGGFEPYSVGLTLEAIKNYPKKQVPMLSTGPHTITCGHINEFM